MQGVGRSRRGVACAADAHDDWMLCGRPSCGGCGAGPPCGYDDETAVAQEAPVVGAPWLARQVLAGQLQQSQCGPTCRRVCCSGKSTRTRPQSYPRTLCRQCPSSKSPASIVTQRLQACPSTAPGCSTGLRPCLRGSRAGRRPARQPPNQAASSVGCGGPGAGLLPSRRVDGRQDGNRMASSALPLRLTEWLSVNRGSGYIDLNGVFRQNTET